MKTITIILLFTLLISGCRTKTSSGYAGSLSECLSQDDIEVLNKACEIFEAQLKQRYGNLTTGDAYKAFLQDITTMNLPPDFFMASEGEAMLEVMRSTKTFEKIWIRQSQLIRDVEETYIQTTDGQETEPREAFDPYVINPFGAYFKCITKKNERKALNGYFKMLEMVNLVSPATTASDFLQYLSENDLNAGITRISIAIGFYYNTAVLME